MLDLKMEVYTPALELIGFLEIQRSVIWEDKAFSAGSFSVESIITPESLTMLQPENIIWIEGETAGIIEYVQEESGKDGPYITVKGRTLTGILDRRVLWGLYNLKGTVPKIMNALVDDCCINPTRGDVEGRKIPGLVLLDAPAGGDTIQFQATGGTLLERLETLGETCGVAFGVRFNPAVPQMEFWTRWGRDRSIHQSENNPVLYSTELDDVLSSDYTYNSQDYRNVALVAGEGEGADRVYVTVENEVEDDTDIPTPTPPEPTPTTKYTVTLLVDPAGGGIASGGKTVDAGTSITVTASANDGYTFSGWKENGVIVSTDREFTFTVDKNRILTAVFAAILPPDKKITVIVSDNTGLQWLLAVSTLTVAGTPITSTAGDDAINTTVTITDDTVTVYFKLNNTISVPRDMAVNGVNIGHVGTKDEALTTQLLAKDGMTITIAFTPYVAPAPVYTISAVVDPPGGGTVSGGGSYEQGQSVTLKQTTSDGYRFVGWYNSAGVQLGTLTSYTFTPTENTTITAKYAVIPVYSITATIDPSGSGNVTGAGQYREGASVSLKATANDGYNFTDWKEGGSTVHSNADYSFTANKDRDLVATFTAKPKLPSGYTELQYIQSSGTQYIDTGVKPGTTTKIVMDVEPTAAASSTSVYFFDSYTVSTRRYVFRMVFSTSGVLGAMGSLSSSGAVTLTTISSDSTIRRMKLQASASEKTFLVDGKTASVTTTISFVSTMPNILLLSSSGSTSYRLSAKLYSCQIYTGSTLTRDFVPCKNPSGTVGLYDLVGGTFYANAGTGSFAAGPAV